MSHDEFWDIIADSRRDFDPHRREGNMAHQAERLKQLLAAMSADEVQEFHRIFTRFYFDAYGWDLWAAAYIIQGGCGNDGFMDFRFWLVSMGREVYEAAMAHAESLAEVVGRPGVEGCAFEEFGSVAPRVLDEKGMPEPVEPFEYHPEKPFGQDWEDDDLPQRFPKLWAKFGAERCDCGWDFVAGRQERSYLSRKAVPATAGIGAGLIVLYIVVRLIVALVHAATP